MHGPRSNRGLCPRELWRVGAGDGPRETAPPAYSARERCGAGLRPPGRAADMAAQLLAIKAKQTIEPSSAISQDTYYDSRAEQQPEQGYKHAATFHHRLLFTLPCLTTLPC